MKTWNIILLTLCLGIFLVSLASAEVYESFSGTTLNTTKFNFFRSTGCNAGQTWQQFNGIANVSCQSSSANWKEGVQLNNVYDWNATYLNISFGSIVPSEANTFIRIGWMNLTDNSGDFSGTRWGEFYQSATPLNGVLSWVPNNTGISVYLNGILIKSLHFNGTALPTIAQQGGGSVFTVLNLTQVNISTTKSVNLNYPTNNLVLTNKNITLNSSAVSSIGQNLVNSTTYIWSQDGSLYATSPIFSLSGNSNSTAFNNLFNLGSYIWNSQYCQSDNSCFSALSNFTFVVGADNISSYHYNSSTYETASENFNVNISIPNGESISSSSLWYAGISYLANVVNILGDNYTLSRTIDIPLGTGSKNWNFEVDFASGFKQNLTIQNQVVSAVNLSLCGSSPFNVPYINFTAKDEVTTSNINFSIDTSTWNYYLGSGSVYKTLSYSNGVVNSSFAFCLNPGNQTLYTSLNFRYSGTGYPQRAYSPSLLTLTNTTTNQLLYLLSASSGIYSSISVVNTALVAISGASVLVEKQIGNTYVVIGSATTDSAGVVTFFVDPNSNYRFTVSATGYSTAQVTIQPSQSIYTMKLSPTSGGASYLNSIDGLVWTYGPAPGPIATGTYNFNATIFAALNNLENCRYSLVNASNISQVFATSTSIINSSYCFNSFPYTLSAGQQYFGRLEVDTTNTTGLVILDGDYKLVPFNTANSKSGTLVGFFDMFNKLNEFGNDDNEAQFSKFVIFFFIATLILSIFLGITGAELTNPGISLFLVWFLVLLSTVSGFLSFKLGSNTTIGNLGGYGFLIIFTLLCFGFMLNILRRSNDG